MMFIMGCTNVRCTFYPKMKDLKSWLPSPIYIYIYIYVYIYMLIEMKWNEIDEYIHATQLSMLCCTGSMVAMYIMTQLTTTTS